MLVDSDDYWDDDSEWEEYYEIQEKDYPKVIENVQKEFSPFSIEQLDDEAKKVYESIDNETLKQIFLFILSIINSYGGGIRGEEMIKILCGDNIEVKKQIYSKGP
jgi:hypothetical protein